MEGFDVLNMGNISDFYLDHSILHFFYVFKFQDPIISPKKNSSDYRVHGTQNERLEPTVPTQKSILALSSREVPVLDPLNIAGPLYKLGKKLFRL